MITKTTNLDSAYQDLFAEINAMSVARHEADPEVRIIDIQNIESFFGHIEEIAALSPKFLRLPLDEPIFEIDANTRRINIPSEFKANGLSVQNDHLAEIIFFRIDRYFDDMDFSNCNIEINWKIGQKVGKTSKFIMAKDIQPGYVIFGWPVDKEITERNGAVTFAVEFNKKDSNNEKITYRFNTMPISINIKEGLVISDSIEAVSLDEAVLSILTNSSFGEGEAAVGDVIWLTGEGNSRALVLGTGPSGNTLQPYSEIINLQTTVTNGIPSSLDANLFAQAYVDNGTDIRYSNKLGEDITPVYVSVPRTQILVEDRTNIEEGRIYYAGQGPSAHVATQEDFEDETINIYTVQDLNPNLVYFVQLESSVYKEATQVQIDSWLTESPTNLFMKLAKITVNTADSYWIKAQGQKFDDQGNKIGAGTSASTEAIEIPRVVAPSEIIIEKNSSAIIPEEEVDNYSWDQEASQNVVFIADNTPGSLIASAVLDVTGALQFVWQKKVSGSDEFVNMYEGEDEVPYVTASLNNPDITSVQEIVEEGEYQVLVKHFINAGFSDQVSSSVFTASKLAGKITSAVIKYNLIGDTDDFVPTSGNISFDSSANTKPLYLTVQDIEIDGQRGIIEFEWYRNEEQGSLGQLISNAEVLKVGPGDFYYTPVIKNNLNGSIYTYRLPEIFVNDR